MANTARRPKEYSSWNDLDQMKEEAYFKLAFYKVELHDDPKQMIRLNLTYPFARYNLRGQQRSVELNRRSEEWLIDGLVSRVLLNPAFSEWDVAMLIDNRSKGRPQKVLRYFEQCLSGNIRRINADLWPHFTKSIYNNMIQELKH